MNDKRKLSKEIFNSASNGVQKLAQLFPSAVKDGEVDFNALKEELGQVTLVGAEKYELSWAGKSNAKRIAREDILGRTLKYVPQDSKNADTTENLYIEGDNLEVLKLLRQNYYGAIKMIYIDPPYNTGKDFVYHDDFTMSGEESAEAEGETVDGERMVVNQKSTNRFHANWLNMMYPRLKVAKDLLTEDGVIFISIDDNEVNNLKKICNEIFGEDNFVATIANINNPKGRSDDKYFATAHEYIICYKRNETKISGFDPDEKILKRYNKIDGNGNKYRNIDLRKTGDSDKRIDRPNMFYYFMYNINTGDLYPTYEEREKNGYVKIRPIRDDGSDGRWRWGIDTSKEKIKSLHATFMKVKAKWTVAEMDYLSKNEKIKPTTNWNFKDVNSERGTEQFIDLGFEKNVFPRPKPLGTLYRLLKISLNENDIVLDFFSGSATTAHAVMNLNAENGGNRKFIMVQVPEVCDENSEAYKAGFKNICEIGKERIRRAGEKIKTEIEQQNVQLNFDEKPKQIPDIGFKVFCTADTNIRWTHEALKARQIHMDESMLSDKDKLDFMPGFKDIDVVYEVLLHQRDIPLSAEVEKRNEIGERTYFIADAYLVCLEETITKDMLEKLAAVEPLPIKYILRDSAFEDNISLKDETIRRLEALIARNSGENEQTYTVEFI